VIRPAIPSLTGLRFIAALSVVFSHALHGFVPPTDIGAGYWGLQNLYNLASGASGMGMQLFFTLSGFVIHYNYSASIRTGAPSATANFFIARFARLYPLYVGAVAVDLLLLSRHPIATWQSFIEVVPYYLLMVQSWFYVLVGDHSLIYSLGKVAALSWSVSTEWFFYIVYPAICFLLAALNTQYRRIVAAFALCLLSLAAMTAAMTHVDFVNTHAQDYFGPFSGEGPYGQDSFFRWLIYFSPYSRIFEFALGCLVAEIYLNTRSEPDPKWGLILTSLSLALTAVLYFLFFGLDQIPWFHALGMLHMSFGLAPGIGLLIFCCARYDNLIVRFLSSPWMILGGEISYSLYLLHTLVVAIVKGAFLRAFVPHSTIQLDLSHFGQLCVSLVLCLIVSYWSWRLLEVPARNAVRRRFSFGGSVIPALPGASPKDA
jgi:peptidoglycan/LPS O-acetylase OafA/YrhL